MTALEIISQSWPIAVMTVVLIGGVSLVIIMRLILRQQTAYERMRQERNTALEALQKRALSYSEEH